MAFVKRVYQRAAMKKECAASRDCIGRGEMTTCAVFAGSELQAAHGRPAAALLRKPQYRSRRNSKTARANQRYSFAWNAWNRAYAVQYQEPDGHLKRLPPEYKGQRHIVIAKQLPNVGGQEWVEYKERPGLSRLRAATPCRPRPQPTPGRRFRRDATGPPRSCT
jgi:hypothetical protein